MTTPTTQSRHTDPEITMAPTPFDLPPVDRAETAPTRSIHTPRKTSLPRSAAYRRLIAAIREVAEQ